MAGKWYDTKAEKVVSSQPEEGVQLVARGVDPTPDEQARVDAYSNTDTTEKASKK